MELKNRDYDPPIDSETWLLAGPLPRSELGKPIATDFATTGNSAALYTEARSRTAAGRPAPRCTSAKPTDATGEIFSRRLALVLLGI
jgi:hypothetical protein